MKRIIEPTISTYQEFLALQDGCGGSIDAIVWIADLGYKLPDGRAVETGFFMNASSQGFRVLLARDPNTPSFWCPWGQPYIFYTIVKDQNT